MKPYQDAIKLRKMYLTQGLSARQISFILNCADTSVRFWLKRHGIIRSPKPYDDKDLLTELYCEKKMSMQAIGAKFGVSWKPIYTRLKRFNIDRRHGNLRKRKPRRLHQHKHILHRLYHEKQMSTAEIGNMFGKNPETIRYWMKFHNIKRRTISEVKVGRKMPAGFARQVAIRQRGSGNSSWKGGKTRNEKGYVGIRMTDHPFNNNGYILEHRLVMENYLREFDPQSPYLFLLAGNLYLRPEVVVHHEDESRDNNEFSNLRCFPNNGSHITYHKIKRHSNLQC